MRKRAGNNAKEIRNHLGSILAISVLALTLFFVMGQEGCPQQAIETQEGLNFSMAPGISMLTEGKTLEKGETFYVTVNIENWNSKDQQGTVCIKDSVADSYRGIVTEGVGDCQNFLVKASQMAPEQISGKTTAYFPETGIYSYEGLPSLNEPYDAKLYGSLRYQQKSYITGTVTTDESQPPISQEPQPIFTSVVKSIHREGDSYKINLEIHLKNAQTGTQIYSPDFSQKNKFSFMAELKPLMLQCVDVNEKPISQFIELEEGQNEKIIKCSALTQSLTPQSYPLVISLDYGVVTEKAYSFKIKTK